MVKEAQKRTHRQGWAAIADSPSSWAAMIMLVHLHRSLAVVHTTGLRNVYTFSSGFQAQEIWLGSPDHFPCERCDLGLRLWIVKGHGVSLSTSYCMRAIHQVLASRQKANIMMCTHAIRWCQYIIGFKVANDSLIGRDCTIKRIALHTDE